MKIAFVTDDNVTISRHFGRAQYYAIYTLDNGEVTHTEQITKPMHHHQHHNQSNVEIHAESPTSDAQRHEDMFAPLEGCAAVLTRGMGHGAHRGLIEMDIKPIITDIATIEDALKAYLDGTLVDHPEKLH